MRRILFVSVLIIVSLPGLLALTTRKVVGINNQNETRVSYIYGEEVYKRSFISPKDRLVSISFRMKNSDNKNSDPFTFTLYQDDKEIRTLHISGSNIKDSQWTRFVFAELSNSKNATYTYTLKSDTKMKDQALGIYVTNQLEPTIITNHRVTSYPLLLKDIYISWGIHFTRDQTFMTSWLLGVFFCTSLLFITGREKSE